MIVADFRMLKKRSSYLKSTIVIREKWLSLSNTMLLITTPIVMYHE